MQVVGRVAAEGALADVVDHRLDGTIGLGVARRKKPACAQWRMRAGAVALIGITRATERAAGEPQWHSSAFTQRSASTMAVGSPCEASMR